MCVYLEQPQASIDAIQYVAIVARTLGVALLADVHHTLATDCRVSCSCHTVWAFCCVCTPLSLDSLVVVEDDEVDAGAGVLPDDVDVSLSSADN